MLTLLILGCGKSQAPLIIKAQQMGFKIIGVDKNPDSYAAKIVDLFICESTYSYDDLNANPKFTSIKKIDGILIKSSGIPILTSSKIAKKFNIPHVPLESVKKCIYKDLLKIFCKENKIYTANWITLNKLPSQSFLLEKDIEFPIVLRPAISVKGKSGIYLIKNFDDLKKYFDKALMGSLNNKVILDKYVDGIDYQIFGFVDNSKFYQTFILEEMNYFGPDRRLYNLGFKTLERFFDICLNDKITKLISSLINKLSIKRSPFFLSLRVPLDGPNLYVIEIHLDLGGEFLMDEFLPKSMNIDFIATAINASIGDIKTMKDIKIFPKAMIFKNPHNRRSGYEIFSYKDFFKLDENMKERKIKIKDLSNNC